VARSGIVPPMEPNPTTTPGAAAVPAGDGRRVLVTGASGYIGANVVAALLGDPGVAAVVAGVRERRAGEELAAALGGPSRLEVATGRLPEDPWALDGVDTLVHVAGVRPGLGVDDTRILLVNQEGTRRLLEKVPGSGVRRVVFVSALSVYGWRRPPPWRETMAPRPQTAYGLSKWVGEFLCKGLDPAVGVMALRLARVYGVGLGRRLVWTRMPHRFALLAARGETIPVFGTGEQRLDLVHIDDVAAAVRSAALAPGPARHAVLNVGGGDPVTTRQLAELCAAVAVETGRPAPAITSVPEAGGAGPDFGLDITRARRVLGWEPRRGLADGLRELVQAASA
jgi:nucleoside-diphosphate-sugar epimerase